MSESTPDDDVLADIERLLHMFEGARIATMREAINRGDVKQATRHAGEVNAFRTVRESVTELRETGELPDFVEYDHWQAYAEMAAALARADAAVGEAAEDTPDGLGVQ